MLEPAYTDVPQWLAQLLIEQKRYCDAVPVLESLFLGTPHLAESKRLTAMLASARKHPGCAGRLGTGSVQLQFLGDDQMLDIDARIGGRPYAAVLDTGASFVTVPESVANDLGFDLTSAPTVNVSVIGAVKPARRIVLEEIRVGGAVATKVPAIVVETVFPETDTILLGMSFLSRFRMTYDPRDKTLRLEEAGAASDEPQAGPP